MMMLFCTYNKYLKLDFLYFPVSNLL